LLHGLQQARSRGQATAALGPGLQFREHHLPALLLRERGQGMPLLRKIEGVLEADPGVDARAQIFFRVAQNHGFKRSADSRSSDEEVRL